MIQAVSGMGVGMMGLRGAQGRPDAEQAFNKIDQDGDGALNAGELQSMFDRMPTGMGRGEGSTEDLMAKLDGDGDGALSFAEFAAGRPQGPPQGLGAGGMMPNRGFGSMEQMDLSSLFGESEDDSEAEEENIYMYA